MYSQLIIYNFIKLNSIYFNFLYGTSDNCICYGTSWFNIQLNNQKKLANRQKSSWISIGIWEFRTKAELEWKVVKKDERWYYERVIDEKNIAIALIKVIQDFKHKQIW
jgi:hypothetical protein